MGLDQYLNKVKENGRKRYTEGACGGLFPMGVRQEGEQIGYWRKDYAVHSELCNRLLDDQDECPNCKPMYVDEDALKDLIERFEERKQNIIDGEWDSELEYSSIDYVLEMCDKTINIFKEALKAQEDGYKIYYLVWY